MIYHYVSGNRQHVLSGLSLMDKAGLLIIGMDRDDENCMEVWAQGPASAREFLKRQRKIASASNHRLPVLSVLSDAGKLIRL